MLQIVKIYLLVLIRQNCYFLLEYILEAKKCKDEIKCTVQKKNLFIWQKKASR